MNSTFSGVWPLELALRLRRPGLPLVRTRKYSVFLLQGILAHILVCRTRNMVVGRIHEVLGPAPFSVGFSYTRSWKFNLGVFITPEWTPGTPVWALLMVQTNIYAGTSGRLLAGKGLINFTSDWYTWHNGSYQVNPLDLDDKAPWTPQHLCKCVLSLKLEYHQASKRGRRANLYLSSWWNGIRANRRLVAFDWQASAWIFIHCVPAGGNRWLIRMSELP